MKHGFRAKSKFGSVGGMVYASQGVNHIMEHVTTLSPLPKSQHHPPSQRNSISHPLPPLAHQSLTSRKPHSTKEPSHSLPLALPSSACHPSSPLLSHKPSPPLATTLVPPFITVPQQLSLPYNSPPMLQPLSPASQCSHPITDPQTTIITTPPQRMWFFLNWWRQYLAVPHSFEWFPISFLLKENILYQSNRKYFRHYFQGLN